MFQKPILTLAVILSTSFATSTFAAPVLPKSPEGQMVWAKKSKYRMLFKQRHHKVKQSSATVIKDVEEYFNRCIKGRVQQIVRRNGSVFDESAYTTGTKTSGGYTYIYGKKHRLIKNDIVELLEPIVRIKANGSVTEMTITRQINNNLTEKNIVATAKGMRRGCATLAL
jgi:hypothetical protein